MNLLHSFITFGCKVGLEFYYKIKKENWGALPENGPFICFTNHTGVLEAPLSFTQLQPRKVTGLAKIESWENPFLNFIFTLWDIIPVHRGEADMEALKKCLKKLAAGYVLGMAPEGTRSKTGELHRAHSGIALLALKSGAPIIPIGQWSDKILGLKKPLFRRPRVYMKVGRLFYLDARGETVTKEVRQQMADEMMYELARQLPEPMRGEYADLGKATEKYLRFA